MHTVYGIYEVGSDVALYVGSTKLPIQKRFEQHVYTGAQKYLREEADITPTYRLKCYWMWKHLCGAVTLVPRVISTHAGSREGCQAECDAIRKLQPILNTLGAEKKAFTRTRGWEGSPGYTKFIKYGCGLNGYWKRVEYEYYHHRARRTQQSLSTPNAKAA